MQIVQRKYIVRSLSAKLKQSMAVEGKYPYGLYPDRTINDVSMLYTSSILL